MEPSRSLRAESTAPSRPEEGTLAALAQTLTPHRLLTAEAKGLLFQSTWSWISLTPVPGPQPEQGSWARSPSGGPGKAKPWNRSGRRGQSREENPTACKEPEPRCF